MPGISRANACQYLQLHATVGRPIGAAFQRRVQVSASCQKTHRSVTEPQIGCGECHPYPDVFNPK